MPFDPAIFEPVQAVTLDRGVPAVYTPPSGPPVEVTILHATGGDARDAGSVRISATGVVLASELPSPEKRGTITLDGVTWSIDERHGPTAGVWELELSTDMRSTFKRG